MLKRIKIIAILFVFLIGVLGNVFATNLVHATSKISIEKSAVGYESIKAWEGLIIIPTLRKNIDWLSKSSKWIDEGAKFVTTGGVTKLRKGADDILEIKNEKILPSKYDFNPATQKPNPNGTPVGENS